VQSEEKEKKKEKEGRGTSRHMLAHLVRRVKEGGQKEASKGLFRVAWRHEEGGKKGKIERKGRKRGKGGAGPS